MCKFTVEKLPGADIHKQGRAYPLHWGLMDDFYAALNTRSRGEGGNSDTRNNLVDDVLSTARFFAGVGWGAASGSAAGIGAQAVVGALRGNAAPAVDGNDPLSKAFRSADANGDGLLEPHEIDRALQRSGPAGEEAGNIAFFKNYQKSLSELVDEDRFQQDAGISARDFHRLRDIAQQPTENLSKADAATVEKLKFYQKDLVENLKEISLDLYSDKEDPLKSIHPWACYQPLRVGNCYFVSALASLAASNPKAIQNMIKDNKNGTYTVTFPGRPDKPITVNAPTQAELIAYNCGSRWGTWSTIMQKAYGKLSNEESIRGGRGTDIEGGCGGSCTNDGVRILSGKSVSTMSASTDAKELGETIRKQLRDGKPVTAYINGEVSLRGFLDFAITGDTGPQQTEDLGIPRRHEYSVLHIKYDEKNPGDSQIWVRNPWGNKDSLIKIPLSRFQRNFTGVAYPGE